MTSVRGSVSPAPDAPSVGQLFARAPVPMWVYDPETLRFLEVNDEAVRRYGYAREEFLAMTIADIRPREDVPRLLEDVASARGGGARAGTWRHRLRDGSVVDVEVSSVDVEWGGRTARLVAAVDVREREEARREHARALARGAAVVAASLDAVVLMDHEGRIVEFNPAAERVFGYRREEVLGRTVAETLVPPSLRAAHREGLARFLRTGEGPVVGNRVELTARRADGAEFPVEVSIVRVDVPGEVLFAGSIRDLSERKRAEAELAAWAAAFELALWGIAEVDPAGNILRANPAFAAMHGARPEDLVGRSQLDLYAPEARERAGAEIAEAVRTGHRIFEAPRARADGSTFPALVDVTSLRDERGREVKRLVGVLDVSEQRRAWDRLAFLAETGRLLSSGDGPEETLAAVARAAVPAVADWCTVELTDPDGAPRTVAVVAADPDTQRRLEEFVRRFPPTPDDDRGVALAAGRPVLLERVDRALLEARAPGPDALALLLELDPRSAMLVPIVVGDRAEGLVSFVRSGSGLRYGPEDLAMAAEFARRAGATIERARLLEETRALAAELERRVEERTRELREINAELDAFAYSVSHDLRAPLRAMEGFARALEEDYADRLDETGCDYVRRVVRAAQRMDVLIQDLLAYSRLARADLPLQAVELDAAAAEALDRVAADVAARGAEVDVPVGMPAVVAHPATLVQVLSNLLSNAVKFVAPGVVPRVRVRAERRGEAVRVEVVDNGIGVDPAHRERIFRVLERLHGADAYPGTGIGLAIVRRGVERMGGRVGVESEPGRGSAFWFELPGADP